MRSLLGRLDHEMHHRESKDRDQDDGFLDHVVSYSELTVADLKRELKTKMKVKGKLPSKKKDLIALLHQLQSNGKHLPFMKKICDSI